MTSIVERAMGADFTRLHPMLQMRLSVGVASGKAHIGRGTMDRIWHGRSIARPFLWLGSHRNILVPRRGTAVPFVIENVPCTDPDGREALTFVRTFRLPGGTRRFDATMVFCEERRCVVDHLGSHQHLSCDLRFTADEEGALLIRSRPLRFREGRVDLRVPDPVGGRALVRESFDEHAQRFRVDVRVTNPLIGPVIGYSGSFTSTFPEAGAALRPGLRPLRWNERV